MLQGARPPQLSFIGEMMPQRRKSAVLLEPLLSYRLLSWRLAQECLQAQKSHVQHMSSLLESSRSSGAAPTGDCVKMPSS